MSWIRSSKGTALVALLALGLALAAVGTAGAISLSDSGVPDSAEAGKTVEATITVEDPFVNMTDTWTLAGDSELVGGTTTWTVTVFQQGEQVSENVYEGQNFTQKLNVSNGGDTVEIQVRGEVPSPDTYSYDPPQTFTLYQLESVSGNTRTGLGNATVHHYTNASKNARQAIDSAAQTINETGASGEAQNLLNNSISAFDSGNFGNAEDLAGQAESAAEEAQQSQQTQQTLLYGAVAVVALLVIGGGIYYWRSQQDDYQKLQ